MECLLKYRWPGNVRELENLVERLTILVTGPVIRVSDLPEKLHQLTFADIETASPAEPPCHENAVPSAAPAGSVEIGEGGIDLNNMVSTMERNMIRKALEKAGGVRSKAAQLLGLNRTTLLEKMKKMGIEMQKK
jgi:DNA-binding NtrC family response regulator